MFVPKKPVWNHGDETFNTWDECVWLFCALIIRSVNIGNLFRIQNTHSYNTVDCLEFFFLYSFHFQTLLYTKTFIFIAKINFISNDFHHLFCGFNFSIIIVIDNKNKREHFWLFCFCVNPEEHLIPVVVSL